jgi:hypothetical protein
MASYDPDIEKWRKHFVDMVHGKVKPDHMGRYIVVRAKTVRDEAPIPPIQIVTPMAQAVELAKSELSQESKVNKRNPPMRKAPTKKVPKNKKLQPKDVFDK